MNHQACLAIVGTGRMAQTHLAHLQRMRSVQVTALCDPLQEGVQEISGIKLTRDFGEIAQDPRIDGIIIAAPSKHHIEYVEASIQAGKHVFCEKPVAFEPTSIRRLNSLAKNTGVRVQVGFNRRFDPTLATLKRRVDDGEIGDSQLIKITNRDPSRPDLEFVKSSGGMFMDLCIHDFDMLRYITGSNIVDVYAMGRVSIDPELEALDDLDTTIITCQLANGAMAIIDSSRETGYGYDQQVEVFGSNGMLKAHNQRENVLTLLNHQGHQQARPAANFMERFQESYRLQMEAFISAWRESTAMEPGLEDAEHAVAAAFAARNSWKANTIQCA